MKNKILICSKQILSLFIVLSLLAVSLFTTDINLTANAVTGTTDTWDGSYTTLTDEDGDGIITISTASELAWAILKSGSASAGITYKVADGITAFYMNENTADLTLEQVKNSLNGNNTNVWQHQGNYFQGTLDGNGVTIYGLYSSGASSSGSNDGGLIPYATGDVTVKNIAIKNSYISGYKYSAAIISNTDTALTSFTVEQCVVANNYITQVRSTRSSGGSNYAVGAIGGYIYASAQNCSVTVDNCLIYSNTLHSTSGSNVSGTFAEFYASQENVSEGLYKFSNLVISGATPWCGGYSYYGRKTSNFLNVYTDTDASEFTFNTYLANQYPDGSPDDWCTISNGYVDMLNIADMQGEAAKTNMPNLTWGSIWAVNESGFPSLAVFSTNDSDGGSGDGEDGGSTDDGDDTTVTVSDTWDGTIATAFASGSGTTADPYIIETAEQLAYLASGADGTTGGNYYKVADGIEAFDMKGFEGITLDSTLANVKAATKTGNNWSDTYQSDNNNAFCGSFDGNGLIIYNLYGQGSAMGLFPCIKGSDSVEIKNVTVKNSYFEATASGYGSGAGAIFGKHTNLNRDYPITIEKCVVDNCYIANSNTSAESYAGAIGGTVRWSSAIINNCRISDNELSSGTVSKGGLIAAAQSGSAITATNCIVIGTMPYPSGTLSATDTNFTDLVAASSYSNIYTDQTVDGAYTGITILTTDKMKGDNAIANMSLDWGSNWKTQENDYPIPFTYTVSEGVWNGEAAQEYSGGDGTEAHPFIIENAAQLYKMVKENGEDSSGNAAYFKVKDGVYDIYCNPVKDMTADEIIAYFKSNATYKSSWNPQTREFNGNFDGNGVTIHGLYNVANVSGTGVAFLPQVRDSNAVIKNVEFKNCYFKNDALGGTTDYWSNAAVVIGRAYNSTVELKNIAVYDSTVIATHSRASVFIGVNGAATTIDTAFTSGNTLTAGTSAVIGGTTYYNENILYGSWAGSGTPPTALTVTNSVFTESDEQLTAIGYKVDGGIMKLENTYTAGVTVSSITGILQERCVAQENMKGDAAKTNMSGLDYSAWITTGSYPVIAALHDITYTKSGDNGHSITCADCDLSVALDKHNYDSAYKCTLCGFEHTHTLVDTGIDYDATCVDSGVMNVKCEYCDYISTREICAKNHSFGTIIPATAGNCKTEATVAYKTCSVCELCFTTDADITSKEPLEHIGTGYTARHDWVEQQPLNSECSSVPSVAYFKCSVCDIYLVEGIMSTTAPTDIDGHTVSGNYVIGEDYHANVCAVCGEDFNAQSHTDANNDSICDICLWFCGEYVFKGASITLKDSIAVNYMIDKNVLDKLGYDNLHIKFTLDDKDYTVSEYTVREEAEQCVFTFDKIGPQHMNCIIYATLCATKGDVAYESKTYEYSIRKYCHNILEEKSNDQKLRTLIVDLLNYGAQAQVYEQHNSANPANAKLTDAQKAWGTQSTPSLESHKNLNYSTIENPSVTWMAGGLYLDERATLRFTIKAQDTSNLTVEVKCGEKTWKIPSSEFVLRNDVGNSDMYYVYINGINATQMRDIVYLTVYNDEEPVSNTVSYSIVSYAYSNTNSDISDLLISMIKYGDSAKAYANSQ